MQEPGLPSNEAERLAALHKLNILDTSPEERFDHITRLVAELFDVPIALINFVDAERQWNKSRVGLEEHQIPSSRALSFCGHAILENKAMVVHDAQADTRFTDNPFVTGDPHIRFYAGQPLQSPNGQPVGTLCIIDRRPRVLSEAEQQLLHDFTVYVETKLLSGINNMAEETQVKEEKKNKKQPWRYRNWSISLQLLLGPILLALILLLSIADQWNTLRRHHETSSLITESQTILNQALVLDNLLLDMENRLDDFTASGNDEWLALYTAAREQFEQELSTFRTQIEGNTEAAAHVDRLVALFTNWEKETAAAQISMILNAEPDARGQLLLPDVDEAAEEEEIDTIRSELRQLIVDQEQLLNERVAADETARRATELRFIPTALISVAMVILTGFGIRQTILGINSLSQAARQVASGDLSTKIPAFGGSELTRTAHAFNTMTDSLNRAHRDLAEQKLKAQGQAAAAERARSETRAVLDSTREAIFMASKEGNVLSVNARVEDLFGIKPDLLIGFNFNDFRPLMAQGIDDAEAFMKRWHPDNVDENSVIVDQFTTNIPERRHIEVFSTPVKDGQGYNIGRLYAYRDVTQEREVDRMKSEFVSQVSHELRTPLTSIKGYVDLILEGDAGKINSEQHEFLTIVRTNADRLVTMVNDLLDLSRIEAGKIELQMMPLHIVEIIQGCVSTLWPQIQHKRQALTLSLPESLPAVLGDPDRIRQIIINLLSNAHKYTPEGGHIEISAQEEGQTVQINVKDSGIGLSADDQARLFTRFFRARNRATLENRGTGLGLAITRTLVEMQGGEISVSSIPDQGSTFSFTLPITEQTLPDDTEAAELVAGKRILVVDDEPESSNLISRYLERAGYVTLVANNAHDALNLARTLQPDLITLDVVLPHTDGFALLEWLKHDQHTHAIPVIVLTITDDKGHGLALGAADFLTKPIGEQHLLQAIQRILLKTSI